MQLKMPLTEYDEQSVIWEILPLPFRTDYEILIIPNNFVNAYVYKHFSRIILAYLYWQ